MLVCSVFTVFMYIADTKSGLYRKQTYKYNLACSFRHLGKLVCGPFRSFPTNFRIPIYIFQRPAEVEIKTTITCRYREISSQELFDETWPKMTFLRFLAKCVLLMANNVEQEINIDGILLEICSRCVCCPGRSIIIWFLSYAVRQRSSSNFNMRVC